MNMDAIGTVNVAHSMPLPIAGKTVRHAAEPSTNEDAAALRAGRGRAWSNHKHVIKDLDVEVDQPACGRP